MKYDHVLLEMFSQPRTKVLSLQIPSTPIHQNSYRISNGCEGEDLFSADKV